MLQLLGSIDMDTREWSDGVLTFAARQVVKEPQGTVHSNYVYDWSFVAYLHWGLRTLPIRIRTSNPTATLYCTKLSPVHGLWLGFRSRSWSWSGSLIITIPILGQTSLPGLGSKSVSGYVNKPYLLPANEVWGKVMFSQVSVYPQRVSASGSRMMPLGWGCAHTLDTHIPGHTPWTHTQLLGHTPPGHPRRHTHVHGKQAGGTHPIMLSCFEIYLIFWTRIILKYLSHRNPVVDSVWRRYWSRMDWVIELRSWRQPIAYNALWWENPVWSECELSVWDARPELCLSSHHLTDGNDLPQVGILKIYCERFFL